MNSSHEKIGMRLNTIDDINFYEWYAAETSYQIIFVGGAFVTIQTYFDFLDHISSEMNVRIVAIPLLYQDHSSFKLLDFSFEKQKKIIERILNKVSSSSTKNIFMGVDIGASIGMYLNHDFIKYYLVNPFYDWNPSIQNKFLSKLSSIPFLYDFIREYLIKFISFNIFFRIPQKFVTILSYQHLPPSSADSEQLCTTCKPAFNGAIHKNMEHASAAAAVSTSNALIEGNHFNIIEFIALNTFFEIANFSNIDEKLKSTPKNVFIFLNENTITNIKSFYEMAKKSGIQSFFSVSDLQYQLALYLLKKTRKKERAADYRQTSTTSYNNRYPNSNNLRSAKNVAQNYPQPLPPRMQRQPPPAFYDQGNRSNVSALPAFMTAQPPPDPLQPLLDLFQNNPSSVLPQNTTNTNMGYINNGFHNANPMQNYLSGISSNMNYTNSFGAPKSANAPNSMMFGNAGKINPQHHLGSSNIQYNTGTLN